jgi:spermidine synthase
MYHVIGTAITVSLLYIISIFFHRVGVYSLTFHRKIWNTILAIAFLFTALAGIFMALQINFKWNIPIINSILKWHVETGVCLGLTGIFHFLWHLSYFGKIFITTENQSEPLSYNKMSSSLIGVNLFLIGFTSTSIQFLLIREVMNISGGYELITGVFLGSWLIASATGAALAGKSKLNDIRKINLLFSLSPLASIFLMILLSRLILETGETPSFLISMIFTFILLFPFCLVSGFTFVKLLSSARKGNNFSPGKSFSIETTGGIVAGLIISLLTSGFLNTYQILLVIILLSLSYSILTFYINDASIKTLFKVLFAVLISVVIVTDPDILFRQLLLPGVKVIKTQDTPYGNITEGEYSGENTTYYNQRLLTFKNNAIEREEDIHYALLQRSNPGKVILISGSLESHLGEVLKYPVKKIFFIERDPALVKKAMSVSTTATVQLIVENKDAFRYIRSKGEKVDAVILLLPPPSTLSLNRFYTKDFFGDVKERLVPGGIFMCSPGPVENYLNLESINLYSSIFNSLSAVFRYVKPVAGNKLYFIASDKELSVVFCGLTEARGIRNIYVGPDYLADDLIEKKSAEIIMSIDPAIRENRAQFPIASFHFQSYNLSKNLNEKIPAGILLILAFAVPLLAVRRSNMIMYFSASALAGFEIIILLTLQLTVGNMYQFTGIILAALMTGLAAGAGMNLKVLNSLSVKTKSFSLIIFYAVAALCFNYIIALKEIPVVIMLILISTILPSFLTGHIFRELTNRNSGDSVPASIYSADLAGSALGFILISGVVVPAFGIRVSIIFLALLIFTGILFGTNRNKL